MAEDIISELANMLECEAMALNDNLYFDNVELVELEKSLGEIRRRVLPECTTSALWRKIQKTEKKLCYFVPLNDLHKLKELIRLEDKLFDYRKAYQFAKSRHAQYSNETECTIAFFRSTESTEVAQKIGSEIVLTYLKLNTMSSSSKWTSQLLQEYLQMCRERYSFFQTNTHLFIGFGYKGFSQ